MVVKFWFRWSGSMLNASPEILWRGKVGAEFVRISRAFALSRVLSRDVPPFRAVTHKYLVDLAPAVFSKK